MTPMTRNGWLRTRIDLTRAVAVLAETAWSLTVLPRTHTLSPPVTSCGLKNVPLFIGHARMSGRSTSVPVTRVNQFMLPFTTCCWFRDLTGDVLDASDFVADALGIFDASRPVECQRRRGHPA